MLVDYYSPGYEASSCDNEESDDGDDEASYYSDEDDEASFKKGKVTYDVDEESEVQQSLAQEQFLIRNKHFSYVFFSSLITAVFFLAFCV